VKILLLVSAMNGLSQRVWCALERAGHDISIHLAAQGEDMTAAVEAIEPDLILCPFLKARVPESVWRRWRTIIIHPGPVGDRGPSSLDWAITDAEPRWGVTALQAVEEMDAGPIWATRTFVMPDEPIRKSALYNGLVADAAMECVEEVLTKAADRSFVPVPLDEAPRDIPSARLRPTMKQADRSFEWADTTAHIIRRIRAADGSPGVRTTVAGVPVFAYDAVPGLPDELDEHEEASPGAVLCQRAGALHVRTGDGSIWLGHLRHVPAEPPSKTVKLPAASVLNGQAPPATHHRPTHQHRYPAVHYRRSHDVGWLSFDFYNGAMSTRQCRRLLAAIRHAVTQDLNVLVVQGSTEVFSNGIHLNVIEAAKDPAREAWSNIKAINAVCKQLLTAPMTVITALNGSAGAGGVMLALGGDVVVAREGVVLNPYYDIGLTGSELHTYTLPRRVGGHTASRLLEERRPVDTTQAVSLGLIDAVGPRDPESFSQWLADLAATHAASAPKINGHDRRVPLDAIEIRELAEMSHDMFDDRLGFTAARHAFVHKLPR
jgi:putative two-component system protein, hydrogenase maturation factor HypX/HoxX